MHTYAQFFVGDREGVGTDSVLGIDGRLGMVRARAAAEERLKQLQRNSRVPYIGGPRYTGYELRRCLEGAVPFGHYRVIYRSMEVGDE